MSDLSTQIILLNVLYCFCYRSKLNLLGDCWQFLIETVWKLYR